MQEPTANECTCRPHIDAAKALLAELLHELEAKGIMTANDISHLQDQARRRFGPPEKASREGDIINAIICG